MKRPAPSLWTLVWGFDREYCGEKAEYDGKITFRGDGVWLWGGGAVSKRYLIPPSLTR
jgi:hypothetical protein